MDEPAEREGERMTDEWAPAITSEEIDRVVVLLGAINLHFELQHMYFLDLLDYGDEETE